ncbi:MAG TPA: hypothetical protein VNJ08_06185 [Bacteriovoracaceae bacterium]|nr:hypothetical protein [Bacteriovoracaceae bacterium]
MKKASTSFLVLAIAALFISLESFAQRAEVITERVQQTIRPREILRLSQLLRLSPHEQSQMEVLSLSILAQGFQGRSELSIGSFGRPLTAPQRVKRQLTQVILQLPPQTLLEGLELNSSDDIFIESITVEISRIRSRPGQHPRDIQVQPNQLLTLQLHQQVRGHAEIPLKQLVKQQLGLSLEGAEIQRIIVEGQPVGGRMATVQVELNNRLVGQPEILSIGQRRNPILISTSEEVRGNLRLHVRGDAFIQQIVIRVGQVRGGHVGGRTTSERIIIRTEMSSGRVLELSLLRPNEHRLVSSISIQAHSRYGQAELTLLSLRGELLGSIIVGEVPMQPRIQLMRPLSLRELRLQSWTPVTIESLEVEFVSDQFSIGRL